MITCSTCQTENPDTAGCCDSCGAQVGTLGDARRTLTAADKPKMPGWRPIIRVVVALFVFGALLAVLVSCSGNDATSTATAVVDPAENARPTETSGPADERSSAFVEYADAVVYELLYMSDGMTRTSELLRQPDLDDQGWIAELASAIVTIRRAYKALEEMDVAPEFQDLHDVVLDSTVDCYDAMDHLVSGIDNGDAEELERANELIVSCSRKMGEASELLKSTQE